MGDGRAHAPLTGAWKAAIVAAVAVAIALRLYWFSIYDILHADELMQYLEQGNRLATGHGVAPWESRFGLRNQLIPQLLAGPLALGHWLAPGTLAAVWMARLFFAALTLLALPAAWRIGALTGRIHAFVAMFAVAVWWESVLYSDLLLSESFAAALLLCAAALMLDPATGRRGLVLAGLLMGLGVLVRLQFGAFALVLAAGALGSDRKRWVALLIGSAIAAAIGAASDLAAGLTPFSWVWTNVAMNIGEGRASRFGTAGPVAYLALLREHLWPIMALVFVSALLAGTRYRPLFYAALVNIAVHSAIAHKEYRFIWLSVLSLLVLAAIGTARLPGWLAERRGKPLTPAGVAFGTAVLLAAWTGASAWSAHATGGIPFARVGGTMPRLANRAVADPRVCGIGIAFDNKAHLVPALLARPVPILLGPQSDRPEKPRQPQPTDFTAGANALILLTSPPGHPEYRKRACGDFLNARLCLYVRPGGCAPAPERTYQRMLEKNDL